MSVVPALAVTVLLSAVLLSAALAKAVRPARFETTLRELGASRWLAHVGRLAVPAAEAAAGIASALAVGTIVPVVVAVGFGAAFAGAGAVALSSGRPISCACFGGLGSSLGRRQLAALPVWLAAGAMSLGVVGERISTDERAAMLLAATGSVALWAAWRLRGRVVAVRRRRLEREAAVDTARRAATRRRADLTDPAQAA